ncbi:MAG: uroporphyrinogen-III C-methyltransferase, partial [Pseudomonadota bacterium]
AKRMLVGKRGGRASCRQSDINALMVRLAKQGKQIVRLKSGDPMIFGRGGEELAALHAKGIEAEIIPGVTTALAAASALGVSLTHRDHAQGVKFVTAHSRKGRLPDLDWHACADPATTLVVYMGGRTLPELAQQLLEHGLAPSTPLVVIESVSRPNERRLTSTLATVDNLQLNLDAPILIGIGRVFNTVKRLESPVENAKPALAYAHA